MIFQIFYPMVIWKLNFKVLNPMELSFEEEEIWLLQVWGRGMLLKVNTARIFKRGHHTCWSGLTYARDGVGRGCLWCLFARQLLWVPKKWKLNSLESMSLQCQRSTSCRHGSSAALPSPFWSRFWRFELCFINHTALSFCTCTMEFGVWSCFLRFVWEHSSVCFTNNKVMDKALKQEC